MLDDAEKANNFTVFAKNFMWQVYVVSKELAQMEKRIRAEWRFPLGH